MAFTWTQNFHKPEEMQPEGLYQGRAFTLPKISDI
jgi:hypothetical protein